MSQTVVGVGVVVVVVVVALKGHVWKTNRNNTQTVSDIRERFGEKRQRRDVHTFVTQH